MQKLPDMCQSRPFRIKPYSFVALICVNLDLISSIFLTKFKSGYTNIVLTITTKSVFDSFLLLLNSSCSTQFHIHFTFGWNQIFQNSKKNLIQSFLSIRKIRPPSFYVTLATNQKNINKYRHLYGVSKQPSSSKIYILKKKNVVNLKKYFFCIHRLNLSCMYLSVINL